MTVGCKLGVSILFQDTQFLSGGLALRDCYQHRDVVLRRRSGLRSRSASVGRLLMPIRLLNPLILVSVNPICQIRRLCMSLMLQIQDFRLQLCLDSKEDKNAVGKVGRLFQHMFLNVPSPTLHFCHVDATRENFRMAPLTCWMSEPAAVLAFVGEVAKSRPAMGESTYRLLASELRRAHIRARSVNQRHRPARPWL